jgi:hypothetical protein
MREEQEHAAAIVAVSNPSCLSLLTMTWIALFVHCLWLGPLLVYSENAILYGRTISFCSESYENDFTAHKGGTVQKYLS